MRSNIRRLGGRAWKGQTANALCSDQWRRCKVRKEALDFKIPFLKLFAGPVQSGK